MTLTPEQWLLFILMLNNIINRLFDEISQMSPEEVEAQKAVEEIKQKSLMEKIRSH